MKYYKKQWNETRGDEFDIWGKSVWYLEIDQEGYPVRQMERYENGKVLKYDLENTEDEFGRLGDQVIDIEAFAGFEISQQEFNTAWK